MTAQQAALLGAAAQVATYLATAAIALVVVMVGITEERMR
jgi:hypothetical protein